MRNRLLFAYGLLSFLVLDSAFTAANASSWRLVQSSGTVNVQEPTAAPHLASTNATLAAGAVVTTGGDGNAILTNGKQRITLDANTQITLPAKEDSAMTKVLQDLGTALFSVDKKPQQHFSVVTPLVTAVVKGTTFTVTAGPMSDSVHVVEGLVEVEAHDAIARQYVPAGVTATVNHANPGIIDVSSTPESNSPAPTPQIEQSSPSAQQIRASVDDNGDRRARTTAVCTRCERRFFDGDWGERQRRQPDE